MDAERIRKDFDEIASLDDQHGSWTDRYESFLLSLVPPETASVLDVGCGLGRLTAGLANSARDVVGLDLSSEMISRARHESGAGRKIHFLCGDFLDQDFGSRQFDCVISSAVLHHMPVEVAVSRMIALVRPGGRLVIHDLRSDSGVPDRVRSLAAWAQVAFLRFVRTGRPRSPRVVREAWQRHGAGETYFTLADAQAMANRLLPGSLVYNHWLWRYTIVWMKPEAAT